jgi:hypothetical protein
MIQADVTESPSPAAIKKFRTKNGLTLQKAATLAGVASSTFDKMENGVIKMSGDTWDKLNRKTIKKPNIKTTLETATNYELKDLVTKSKAWFTSEAKSLAASTTLKVNGRATGSPIPGEMYSFYYDAKHKDTLPYWDKFPLVFPFRIMPDGFYGINLHYLHYKERIVLLDALDAIAKSPRKDQSKRLQISYSILQHAAKNKKFEKCIHRYLFSHLKTPLKKIHSDKWILASMLPNEMFVGATTKQIWSL